MNEDIRKLQKLLLTDEDFQNKLKAAAEAYDGEQTEEAVFNGVLVPLAAEYGITATFDEYKEYMSGLNELEISELELSEEEMSQIAGGKPDGGGLGVTDCKGVGGGVGALGSSGGAGICALVGIGWGRQACITGGWSDTV